VDCFGLTDQGKVRRKNDDHFLIASLHKLMRVHLTSLPDPDAMPLVSESRGFLFMVADGVGGRPHGDLASGTALRYIAQYVTHLMDLYNRLDPERETQFLAELEKSVQRSHEILVAETERSGEGRGGATTLTMVAAVWPRAYLVQVGDSRCYRLRDGHLELLTQDHSLLSDVLEQRPELDDTVLARLPKNIVTRALGIDPLLRVSMRSYSVVSGDRYLLCSDGLSGPVSSQLIAETLGAYAELDAISEQLIELANDAGGPDNIAALVIECTDGPKKKSVPPPAPGAVATAGTEARADPELLILGIEELEALDADSASDDLLRALEDLFGRSS
jgi:protein phosphatase